MVKSHDIIVCRLPFFCSIFWPSKLVLECLEDNALQLHYVLYYPLEIYFYLYVGTPLLLVEEQIFLSNAEFYTLILHRIKFE